MRLSIFFRSFFLFLLRDCRERYTSFLAFGGELFGLALSLLVYWYTAKAFGGTTYFNYIILGEVTLFVPLGLILGAHRATRESQSDGTLEALLTMPLSGIRAIFILSAPQIAREFVRATLTLGVAVLLFKFPIDAAKLSGWLLLQLCALPAFFGIGFIAVAVHLRFARGEGVLAMFNTFGVILAGAYFPTSVLPKTIQSVAGLVSPFNILLESTRLLMSETAHWSIISGVGPILLWGMLALPLGIASLCLALESVRKRGSIEIC